MAVRRLAAEAVQPKAFAFTPENDAWAQRQIAKYPPGRQASAVLPLLWQAQKQHDYWLPKPAIETVAQMLGMPYIRVLEIATFYSMFNLEPVGRHFIQLCGTTPCVLRGADDLKKVCRERIGEQHHVSADGRFSWAEVECLGACCNAPMVQINDDYYEDLTAESFGKLMDDLAAGQPVKIGSQVARTASEPEPGKATTLTDEALFDGSRVGAWRQRFAEEEAREKAKAEAARQEAETERAKAAGGTPGAEPAPHDGTPVEPPAGQTPETGERRPSIDTASQAPDGPTPGPRTIDSAATAATEIGSQALLGAIGAAGSGAVVGPAGLHAVDSAAAAANDGANDGSTGADDDISATDPTVEAPTSLAAATGTPSATSGLHAIDSAAAAAAEAPAPLADPAPVVEAVAPQPVAVTAEPAAPAPIPQEPIPLEPLPEAELTEAQRAAEETAMAARLAALPAAATPEQRADLVGTRPAGLATARNDTRDDLKRIKGIGPVNERKLNELGIFHFDQIGAWHRAEVRWVGTYLAFPGRIDREKWVEQAKGLAASQPSSAGGA